MRIETTTPLLLALLAACGSTEPTRSSFEPVAPTPERADEASAEGMFEAAEALVFGADVDDAAPVDRFAPLPERVWTGAFSERSLLLARSIRIEGPRGLLEHVAIASDDQLYERYVETTAEGFLQVVQRASDEVEVVRGSLDAWRLAAEARVTVLERLAECPVRIVAAGDVLWRDIDGNLVRGDRIELVGELGNMTPVRPRIEPAAPTFPNTQTGSAGGDEPLDDETRDDDDAPDATNPASDGASGGVAAPEVDGAAGSEGPGADGFGADAR